VSAVDERLFRWVELLFTAYAVPALIVPVVWLSRRLFAGARGRQMHESADGLRRAILAYAALAAVWLAAWLALRLGLPIEKGERTAGVLSWLAYGLMNLALARLLVRFTAGYGDVPEGPLKDRLFLQFLSAVVAQPLTTACAFSVLYRIMGVVYHMKVPGLTAVQEGI
jgi:hypothetical protein